YRASNEKLADVPADQLFLHFTLHGINEGLAPAEGVNFDAATYLAANEDLVEPLGIQDPANLTEEEVTLLTQHFFAHGYKEDREGGPDIPGWNSVDLDELTGALNTYKDAVEAKAAFLQENLNEGETGEDAIAQRLSDAEDALERDEQDNGTEAQLAAAVTVAEANLAAAQAAYDANASADLKVAVKQYRAETKKLEALKETRDAAQAEAVAQFEAFEDAYPDQSFDAVWDIEEAGGLD